MDYPRELKERVGQWLRTAPYGSQKTVAQALEVTPRTLRQWKRQAERKFKTQRGRRRLAISFREKIIIAREWKRQGYPGERPVRVALPSLRVRVVREVIRDLKARRKKRREVIRMKVRTRVRVNKVGAVLTMDGTSLKKGDDYIVYKDRSSLEVRAQACGGFLSSRNTLGILENLKQKNTLPLVICTDNGSPFCSQEVENFLDKNYIVHLKNLPRVPQHNGSCENAVREFKEQLIENLSAEVALKKLNECRKRQSLNWQTSVEFTQSNYKPYSEEERMKFYDNAKDKIKNAVFGIKSARDKRKIEREEILKTMEAFSLITITRGNQSRQIKAEEIT
jgi:transposase InsO family protein